jgi:hypothetical protein
MMVKPSFARYTSLIDPFRTFGSVLAVAGPAPAFPPGQEGVSYRRKLKVLR